MKRLCSNDDLDHDGDIVTGLDEFPEFVAKKYLDEVREKIKKTEDKFSNDPTKWLEEHCSAESLFGEVLKDWTVTRDGWLSKIKCSDCSSQLQEVLDELDEGTLYVLLVNGVMRETKKYEKDDQDRRERKRDERGTIDDNGNSPQPCHPIWIAAALVTEKHLESVEDPIKIAFKLRAAIREHCKSSEFMYKNIYEDHLRRLPREFAEALLNECLSPEETECLMDIKDRNVLFDLQTGKFRDITERPAYKKLYQEEIFWVAPVYESFIRYGLSGLRRFLCLIFWNIVYPFNEPYEKLMKAYEKLRNRDGGDRSRCPLYRRQLFSPISCFIADLVNYFIMIALIAAVMLQIRPNQESAGELITKFRQENEPLNDSRLRNGTTEGIKLVELDRYPITWTRWTLFLCLLSRILIEFYQLCCQQIWSAVPERLCPIPTWKRRLKKKMELYIKSDMNKVDILLLGFLIIAFGIDFQYSYDPHFISGRFCVNINKTGCDEDLDYTLEARRVTYMTNFYSITLLFSLVRLFHCVFLFIPIIGPILRSIQKMIKDVFKVVVILIFFSVGFFIPLFAIMQCYISVFTSSKENIQASKLPGEKKSTNDGSSEDDEVFDAMKSPTTGFVTMILSIMDGKLTYSDDIYRSKDTSTNIFFFFIMFFYFLIFGLLCLNLLIALISKRYATMMANKDRDWRFAQFDLLVDYVCIDSNVHNEDDTHCNDGMPFFFPFCLLYVPCRLISSRMKKHQPKRGKQMETMIMMESEDPVVEEGNDLPNRGNLMETESMTELEDPAVEDGRKKVIRRVLERRRNRVKRAKKDKAEEEQAQECQGDEEAQ